VGVKFSARVYILLKGLWTSDEKQISVAVPVNDQLAKPLPVLINILTIIHST
jgi:hypothetical protein